MLFDFRIRPPFKSFLTTGGMFGGHDGSHDPAYIDPYETGKDPIPSADKGDMDLFFQEMEANGIDKAGIIGRNCGPNGFVDNADIREFIQKDPNRFFGFAGIDPNAPDAVDEVTRCIRDWGFRGISLEVGWCDPSLKPDDPIIDPVYEKANELGGITLISLSFCYGPDLSYSDPITIQHVANKYPNMKICISHGGWPQVQSMLAVAMRCPNVYLMPDCYLYIPGWPYARDYVKAANSYLKYRTLYASAYPLRGFEQCYKGWCAQPFEPDALKANLYDNAARLLGL